GMTEEIRSHLFDPFFTTKGAKGMGLGLSVVYGIVTRHEGRIDVDTALGRGTTIRLELPATTERIVPPAGGDGASLPRRIRPGPSRVVDDEPEVAEVVKDVLETAGHTVHAVLSGGEAVRMIERCAFDLVLTDLGMPDMSGWEVAERMNELRPGVPVAVVTG